MLGVSLVHNAFLSQNIHCVPSVPLTLLAHLCRPHEALLQAYQLPEFQSEGIWTPILAWVKGSHLKFCLACARPHTEC